MIHFIQHGLVDRHSHFFGETLGYLEAAKKMNLPIQVWTHTKCEPEIVSKLNAQAIFPHIPDASFESDPLSSELTSYLIAGGAFASTLAKHLSPVVKSDDWVFIAYASQNEAYAVAIWLQSLPAQQHPRVILFCHRPELIWKIDGRRDKVSGYPSFWRFAGQLLTRIGAQDRVKILAPDPRLLQFIAWASGLKTQKTGLPSPYFLPVSEALTQKKQFDIGFMGEFRPERGRDLMLTLIADIDKKRPGFEFLLQVHHAHQKDEAISALREMGFNGRVTILPGKVDPEVFVKHITQTRLMVLPYFPDRYRLRSSGVLSECTAYGTPCVVPAQTWLSDQVETGAAAGTVFEKWTLESIAQATFEAIDQIEPLTHQAALKAADWREKNCARDVLKHLNYPQAAQACGLSG